MATMAHCGGSFRSPTTTSSAEVRSTHMIHSAGSRSGLTNDSGCFHAQDDGADSATQLHRLSESPLRRHWLGMAVADADGSGNNTNTTTNTTTTSSSPSTGTSTPAVVPLTDPTVRRRPLGAMRSAQRVVVPRELETATDHPFSPSPHDTTFRPSTVAQTGTTRTDVSAETASNSATSPPMDRPSTTAACRLHSRRRGSRGASAVTFIPLTMDEQLNMRLPILELPPHHTPQHVGQRHVSQMEEHAVRDDADLLLDAPSAVVLATTDEGVFGACDCGDAAASKTPSSGVAALFASSNTHTHAHHHHQQQQQRQPLPIMADASPSPPPTRTHTRVSSYTTLPSVPHFMSFTGVEELLDASPRLNDDDDDLDASWSTGLESSMCGSRSSATSCLFCAAARAGALSDDDDDDDGILEGVALEEGTKRVGSGTMGVRSVDTRTFRGKNHSNNNNEEDDDDGCTNGVGACTKTTVPRKHRCCPHQQPHNHCHHHHRPHRHRRRRLHGVHLRHYYRRSRGDAERPHAPTSHASCEAWSLSYVGLPVFEANANHGGERSPALSRGGGGMNAMMMEGVAEDGRSPSRVSSAQPCWRGVTPGRCPRSPSLMSSKNFPQGATTSADAPRSPVAAQPAKDVAGEAANTSNLLSAPTSPALSTLASGRLHAWAVRGGARRPSLSTGTPSRTRHHAYHRHAGLRAVGSSFTLGDVDGHGQSADDSWSF